MHGYHSSRNDWVVQKSMESQWNGKSMEGSIYFFATFLAAGFFAAFLATGFFAVFLAGDFAAFFAGFAAFLVAVFLAAFLGDSSGAYTQKFYGGGGQTSSKKNSLNTRNILEHRNISSVQGIFLRGSLAPPHTISVCTPLNCLHP